MKAPHIPPRWQDRIVHLIFAIMIFCIAVGCSKWLGLLDWHGR